MKKYFSKGYITRNLKWLWTGKYYILTIPIVIFAILCITNGDDSFQKIVSNLMIIIGLVILFSIQRIDLRRYSNFKSNTLANWIKSIPKDLTVKLEAASISTTARIGKAYVFQSMPNEKSDKEKIDFLLEDVIKIHETLGKIFSHVDDLEFYQTNNEEKISLEINNLDDSVKKLIAGHVVGDYDVNYFAIMITLCGTMIQLFG